MIEKNLNCLSSLSISLCFSQCRRGHTCLKFYKFIIHSVTRTEFFISPLTIAAITSLLRMPHTCSLRTDSPTISLIFCTTSAALISVFNLITEKRNLKASLILIWVKRKASEKNKFRDKSLLPVRHCWNRCDYEF